MIWSNRPSHSRNPAMGYVPGVVTPYVERQRRLYLNGYTLNRFKFRFSIVCLVR
jgi:hypothetical protein